MNTKNIICIKYLHTYIFMCRRVTGAMIRISNTEEHEASGKMERAITISGPSDIVNLAKALINLRLVVNYILNEFKIYFSL